MAMRLRRPFLLIPLLLIAWVVPGVGRSQSYQPAGNGEPGMHNLPPIPGEGPPDLFDTQGMDPVKLRVLREQARERNQLRQKQVVEATALLVKITGELRAEMAKNPHAIPTADETAQLDQIQKLARFVTEKEKAD